MNPEKVLKQTFGYDSFRPGQKRVIDLVLNRQNVLAVMPTGAGKSLCYQVPALMNSGNYFSNFTFDFVDERSNRCIKAKWD